jgi:hypothetical protein
MPAGRPAWAAVGMPVTRPPPYRSVHAFCGLQNYVAIENEGNAISPGSLRQRGFVFGLCADLTLAESFGFRLQIDFRVEVGSAQRHVPEPPADGVDVHASAEQVGRCRVPDGVGADPFCRSLSLAASLAKLGLS